MILLLGATGCLGTQVLRRLLTMRLPVRIITRGQADWQSSFADRFKSHGVEVRYADFTQTERLAQAVEGCDAVINTIGALRCKNPSDINRINFEITKDLIEVSRQCNVPRFIQIGCLGATEHGSNPYFQAKWRADEAVKASQASWTILRPSFMFGEKFEFKEIVDPIARFKLFLPVFGSGVNHIAPVAVENVAECVLLSLHDRSTVGQVYELTGPDSFTMTQLLETLRKHAGLSGGTMNIPLDSTLKAGSFLARGLPATIFNMDLVHMLTSESASTRNDLTDKFGIKGTSLNSYLDSAVKK
jgi:uncharacterized protein YbjT (DUF2867 family)